MSDNAKLKNTDEVSDPLGNTQGEGHLPSLGKAVSPTELVPGSGSGDDMLSPLFHLLLPGGPNTC